MKDLYYELKSGKKALAVVGLGYVGMPLAVAFSKKVSTIGFDVNIEKIDTYKNGIDPTNEVGDDEIKSCSVEFTSDEARLKEANFIIVSVPTPLASDNTPDLTAVASASEMIGRNLSKDSIIVYESTVYPGVTEDICIPILEKSSGYRCGMDFKVGYSPERINPGDKVHRLENIVKIVSGMDEESLEDIARIYELIIEAGVHKVSCMKVAEACKVVENSQRDVNIAFMNELAMVFDRMNINTQEVLDAMNTKWNALRFHPGMVGGHCIGVDPHYFIYEAEKLGYHSQLILSGRRINEKMSTFVGDAVIKQLVLAGKNVRQANVAVLGLTFKEDCPDIRNSKVVDLVNYLRSYGIRPFVYDPNASTEEAKREYDIDITDIENMPKLDCMVFAVAHKEFRSMGMSQIEALFGDFPNNEKIIIDVRSMLDKNAIDGCDYRYWRL
ncbi:MAG: nucleotide sugar dehydrogenase [Defluviitaleaceae bacterium]|nr:nucleotide sugar dehydrogenase [Defluviitaleaceae bacterium]